MTAPYLFSMSAGAGGEGGVWALPAEGLGRGRGESLPGELGMAAARDGRSSELGKDLPELTGASSEGLPGGSPSAGRSLLLPGSPFPECGLGRHPSGGVGCRNRTNRKQFLKTGRKEERGSRAFHTCENRHRRRGNSAGLERGLRGQWGERGELGSPGTFPLPVRLCRGVC